MAIRKFPYTLDPNDIPTAKIVDVWREAGTEPPVLRYACPDACWREHYDAWIKAMRQGHRDAPQPMPYGHCMFKDPVSYGCIPYGCTDPAVLRAAHEHDVRNALSGGWDRDVDKATLERIVKTTVDARLAGKDCGAFPFLACLYATM